MAYNKLNITGANSLYCDNGWLTLAAEKRKASKPIKNQRKENIVCKLFLQLILLMVSVYG